MDWQDIAAALTILALGLTIVFAGGLLFVIAWELVVRLYVLP